VTNADPGSLDVVAELYINGLLEEIYAPQTLAPAASHVFDTPTMAIDNGVRFVFKVDGVIEGDTGWFTTDETCENAVQLTELLFIVGDNQCVDGDYVYSYTLINEYDKEIVVSLDADVNGVVTQGQWVIPAFDSASAGPIEIPTGVPLDVDIDWYIGESPALYRQQGFSSSTGYPECDDGSGAGIPGMGASSTTMALLAGALLACGAGLAGFAALRRRSA
jgi:hypothetical protein